MKKGKRGTYIFWSVFAAAAVFRLVGSFYRAPPDAYDCIRHKVYGNGFVYDDPERKDSGQVFTVWLPKVFLLATSTEPCATDILVRLKTKLYPRYVFGQEISVAGSLSRPMNFSSNNGRSFDFQGYLSKDDVFYEIKSAQVTDISAGSSIQVSFWDRVTSWLYHIKHGFVTNLERTLGEPHAALAAGLVVGEKSALGADLLNDFRIVGLIHIVVLSGFNITIVGVAMRRMLSFLPRIWGIVIGGVGIALFGVLVGGGATVIRSCFMAGMALIADLIHRDYSVERALGFAALVMLIQNPLILLHDPSFQLSFLATLGLILLASPIEKRLGWIPDKFGMRGTVASCFATQIFVSPFILYMMGQISIIGVVVNILVLPFIPVTMLAVFLTGSLGFLWAPLSVVASWFAHVLLSYELFMVEKFARIPFAAIYVPPFSAWWVVGFYATFITIFIWMRRRSSLQPQPNSS